MMQTILEKEVTIPQAEEPCTSFEQSAPKGHQQKQQEKRKQKTCTSFKQPAPEGPDALPTHILPKGSHYRIADSEWWIGYGQGAYDEVSHLQGIVLYNQTTHIFLKPEEAAEAYLLLPELLQQQGQDSQERMRQLQKKLD